MSSCPLPENEAERLASVLAYNILDTAPEVEFDVTTRVAAALFDLPIALVALMDRDRLWFKSRHGLDVTQLDREIAFCAHTIVTPDDLLVITDLKKDSRFDNNPLVYGGPEIRFYAGAPLIDSNGMVLGTLAVLGTQPREFDSQSRALLRDLSVSVMTAIEARQRALSLKLLATTDSLTGLANRMQFHAAAALELRQAQLAGTSIGILYMDLDGFKDINDRLGHAAGDAVLREVALRLKDQLRNGEILARLGGDEFALVMRGGADVQGAEALAKRILESVRLPVQLSGGSLVTVGVSIGIAILDARQTQLERLIEQADQALYLAKDQPNRGWAVFGQPEELAPAVLVQSTEQPFPFTMAFQPIVSASRKVVIAYEALVRGLSGEGASTILSRVNRGNRYAFDQSCRTTAIGLAGRLGIAELDVKLAINFIPGASHEPQECVRSSLAAAQHCNLPLHRLIFEVAEGEEVMEPKHLLSIFDVYRTLGLNTAMDGFGAANSGLNILAQFQPGMIKLDRKLVEDIDASWAKQSVVRGVLSVCGDLNITPVAQGVETLEEYRTLRAMGIDLFQGFLFAKPQLECFPEVAFPADD